MSYPQTSHYDWQPHPHATTFINQLMKQFLNQSPWLVSFKNEVLARTGTRLFDWVDHFCIHETTEYDSELTGTGFLASADSYPRIFYHEEALLPPVHLVETITPRLYLKVESVVDFIAAQGPTLNNISDIQGSRGDSLRSVLIERQPGCEIWAMERHGHPMTKVISRKSCHDLKTITHHLEAFRTRKRNIKTSSIGFNHAEELIIHAISELGVPRTCDLFFNAERKYWQIRNRAARIQKGRQDALGLGWANHDHHTYRSSREHFARLISLLELLGFQCRERFYAGKEAGWGAQVLEQPDAGIVIFADVDLSDDEVIIDFAHQPLPTRPRLGTVGLWCRLHGESFLEAGMHHLECQFDFNAAKKQLLEENVETMPPFTDLPHLKQAFTNGEIWPVMLERIESLLQDQLITSEQAEHFRTNGAIGSHLEILQREAGFKGFNQSGINDIIRKTDPRTLAHS